MKKVYCEDLLLLKEKLNQLQKGIDPHTNLQFPGDTVLNSFDNKKLFKTIYDLFDELMTNKIKSDGRCKHSFYITKEQASKVVLSDTPIAISNFTYLILDEVDTTRMRKLQPTQITSWLLANDYLSEAEQEDGKTLKILTEKSKTIEMTSEKRENSAGYKYNVNLYGIKAQKFILDNLNEITKNS